MNPTEPTCPACTVLVAATFAFCPWCGAKLRDDAGAAMNDQAHDTIDDLLDLIANAVERYNRTQVGANGIGRVSIALAVAVSVNAEQTEHRTVSFSNIVHVADPDAAALSLCRHAFDGPGNTTRHHYARPQ